MGGKSTVMRQVALMVILGQMGAPVPASSAKWGAFSAIYTRIGAQDAISKGQSTFMVEMSELAQILHHADQKALIILDEIGRGTSTYDGISVAWATLEWICTQIRARTLFSTHYHELIRLNASLPSLANVHMAVEQSNNGKSKTLRFLYELREGPTSESFGIHVAQLAGLPKPVTERAWKILEELEQNSHHHPGSSFEGKLPVGQLSFFDGIAR
jgi:DNA mismatch repair protein MutS